VEAGWKQGDFRGDSGRYRHHAHGSGMSGGAELFFERDLEPHPPSLQ
jgi:hypothetical protein